MDPVTEGPPGGCHRSANGRVHFKSRNGADLRNDTDTRELACSGVIDTNKGLLFIKGLVEKTIQ